ncbi:MAG: hypothetical protein LC799_03665, partial [Actinobacteria bacterium]|nr:hypothetical protein [Actinomycetota bacterium]
MRVFNGQPKGGIVMKTQTKALVVGFMIAFIGSLSPATVLGTDGDHDKDRKDHKDSTCYAVTKGEVDATTTTDDGPPFIVRYLTENEGRLISEEEARKLGHLKQQAYSVVGKAAALFHENGDQCVDATCPQTEPNENTEPNGDREQNRIMATVDGTIITGKEHHNGNNESNSGSPDEPGAHMGLDVQFLRFDDGTLAIGPITLECTSPDVDKTPDRWLCNVKAEVQEPSFSLLLTALTPPITLNKVVN